MTGATGEVLLGLGANLGEPMTQLAAAVEALSAVVAELRASSVYRTAPVGFEAQPDFFNLVVCGTTALEPHELLAAVHRIEAGLGRARSFRNAPRTVDIDLLAYDDRVQRDAQLTLPHPRMHQRAFVLVPLAELSPGWRHPLLGATPGELLEALDDAQRVQREGPLRLQREA